MRILANDGLDDIAVKMLIEDGHTVDTHFYDPDELKIVLKSFDVLIVRSATKVTSDVLSEVNGNLKLVIRAGVGIDNIDVLECEKKGIVVKNTPNASSDSVAELVLGHMFCLARFIAISNVTMRNGEWNKKQYKGSELAGKTLGLVGYGRIAKALAKKSEALGMKIVYYDVLGNQDTKHQFLQLDELLATSDFISLHIPYDKNQGALIAEKQFELMKPSCYLIQAARGKVVDEKALLDALKNGKIAGAALDVFEEEPSNNTELLNLENVSVTPHIGASTKEAQQRIGLEVVEVIRNQF